MKIYFAGSIRGGRSDAELYKKIIKHLSAFGSVLTEHVGNPNLSSNGESEISDPEIHDRDLAWLNECDIIVAECTAPSLGVGYELREAVRENKDILVLHRLGRYSNKRISAMINGCDAILCEYYETLDQAMDIINRYFAMIAISQKN